MTGFIHPCTWGKAPHRSYPPNLVPHAPAPQYRRRTPHCLRRAGPFCISPRTWLITVECDETGGAGGFRAETGCIRDWTPSTNPDAFSPQSPACASPLPAPAYNRPDRPEEGLMRARILISILVACGAV